jgi:hypothetical protein
VSGAGASANRRGARAVLGAALALAGIAAVLVVTGREPARRDAAGGASEMASVVTALPASVTSGADAPAVTAAPSRPLWQPPVAVPRARRDEGAAARPERWDSPSFDGDWREQVAAVLGRKAVEGAPQNPGAVHTHLPSVEGSPPEARAPAVLLSSAPAGNEAHEGWDGGKFWFGPDGLVRMKEAQP